MADKKTWDCLKKPFQVIVTQIVAPKDNRLIGFKFIHSHPPPPSSFLNPLTNIAVTKKSTDFYPFCSKFNFL